MNPAIRLRLALLVVAIALVAGLTLWGVQNSWGRINELEDRLTAAHFDSFRLADDFQHRLLNLNNSMLRFAARRDQATWTEFEQASKQLDRWIDEQDPKLNTEAERGVLRQLNEAYDVYLQAAHLVRSNAQPAL